MTGTLFIELLSDACFSMPATLNVAIDTETCTDELGLPRIPGKTLHGLLRDTWLSVSPAFDPDQSRGYALLGEPLAHDARSTLRIGDALMAPDIRRRVGWALKRADNPMSPDTVREAFFDSRAQTKIDRVTGAPETDTLRATRVVPSGTVLQAPLTALGHIDQDLLDDLLALTRHIGLHRNRGMGHTRMRAEWDERTAVAVNRPARQPVSDMLHYRLTLTAPCVLHADNLDPNSCSTLRYIPGSTVRGAIASALARVKDEDGIAELIAGGKAEFLNAYPEENGRRSIPTPATWEHDKQPDEDLARSDPADGAVRLFVEHWTPETQRKPLDVPFVLADPGEFTPVRVETLQNVHQTRLRAKGISTKEETTVYVYEALAAGQAFRGCIRVPRELHGRLAEVLTGTPLILGKSARSGYGGAPVVEIIQPPFPDDELDRASLPSCAEGEHFEAILLSAAVIRDPVTGQHDPWALGVQIAERFGRKARLVQQCIRAGTARGFIRQWRTELPSVPCAAAGSVVLLQAVSAIGSAEVAETQRTPLGERVADGYGRLAILPLPLGDRGRLNVGRPNKETPLPEPEESPDPTVLEAQRAVYDATLRRFLTALATKLVHSDQTQVRVSASLAQRLRTPLRSADWARTYSEWLGNSDAALKERAMDPIRKTRVHGLDLQKFILGVAKPDWAPPSGAELGTDWEALMRQCRIVPPVEAERIRAEVIGSLRGYFLERVLGQLARLAKNGG